MAAARRRIVNVVLGGSDQKMVGVDAASHIAGVANHHAGWHVTFEKAVGKHVGFCWRQARHTERSIPLWMQGSRPEPTPRIGLWDVVALETLSWGRPLTGHVRSSLWSSEPEKRNT